MIESSSRARPSGLAVAFGVALAAFSVCLGPAAQQAATASVFPTAVAAAAIQPPTAPSSISADAVLQRFKSVTGGAAWDTLRTLHTKYEINAGGLSGTSDEWDDCLDGRTVSVNVTGGSLGESGFDGKQAWHKDDSDPAHPDDGEAEQRDAISNAYDTSNSYWYPGRYAGKLTSLGQTANAQGVFDVVRVEPDGGTSYQMWLDHATGLLAKTIQQTAMESSTSIYSDYRAVSGAAILVPFKVVESDGNARYDTVEKIKSVTANDAPPDGVFDMPTQYAPDYSFAGNASSVTVPIQYLQDHIYIPLKINGHDETAMFDTGGSFIVSTEAASTLGLKARGAFEVGGNGSSSVNGGMARADTVQIGGMTLKKPVFTTIPYFDGEGGEPVAGAELLDRFVIAINYDDDTMTLTRPEAFHYSGTGIVVPFKYHDGHMPVVAGSVDGIPGTFTIDTGDNLALTLNGPFNQKNDLVGKYKPKFAAISGYGIGGADPAYVVRTKTLTLGGVSVHDRVTYLRGGKSGAGADRFVSGNVGNGVLHEFNLIFDYPREQIIFEPNKHSGDPDVYLRTGIVFDINTALPTISDVVPGSPAADAGLNVGDTVLSINGISVQNSAFSSIFQTFNFKPAGSGVSMQVMLPSGQTKSVTMVLRDLV